MDKKTGDTSSEISVNLRDYFAAQAMNGILAFNGGNACRDAQIAEGCYEMADAMLKARKRYAEKS